MPIPNIHLTRQGCLVARNVDQIMKQRKVLNVCKVKQERGGTWKGEIDILCLDKPKAMRIILYPRRKNYLPPLRQP
jgi:hypothetical protein